MVRETKPSRVAHPPIERQIKFNTLIVILARSFVALTVESIRLF